MTTEVVNFSGIDVKNIYASTKVLKKEVNSFLKSQGVHIKEIDSDIRQQMLCIKESRFASLMFPIFVTDKKEESKLLEFHVYKNGHIHLLMKEKENPDQGNYPITAKDSRCNGVEMFHEHLTSLIENKLR